MRLPEMKTLVNTAIGVAVAGITAVMYIQLKQLDDISNSTYFKDAFKILRGHAGKMKCFVHFLFE